MARKQKKKFKKRPSNQDQRRRFCKFTALGIKEIDYKDINLLKEFITETGKIIPSRNTCLLYTSPSPRERHKSRKPSSA